MHANKRKAMNQSLEKEKLKKEDAECTFKPKITTFNQDPERQKINITNYFSKQRNENSFYERNVNWKKEIRDKNDKIGKEKESEEGKKEKGMIFKPEILKSVNMDKIFHDKITFDYWLKNNKNYIARKKKLLLKEEQEEKYERFPYLTYKKKRCNSVENNRLITPSTHLKQNDVNRSINVLHYELQQTANMENEEEFDK